MVNSLQIDSRYVGFLMSGESYIMVLNIKNRSRFNFGMLCLRYYKDKPTQNFTLVLSKNFKSWIFLDSNVKWYSYQNSFNNPTKFGKLGSECTVEVWLFDGR